jgi:uncharacterized protein
MATVNITPFEVEFTDRFGQCLKADIYLPEGQSGPFPLLLAASPYQKSLRRLPAHWVFPFSEYGPMQLYLDQGYAYAVLDLPGSGVSEGNWDPWSRAEGESTHDAIEFLARQSWATGKVGMIGQSYFGMSQWNAARTCPPSLTTIVPYDGANDIYRDFMYHGGIPMQGFLGSWLLGSVMLQHMGEGHDLRGGNRHEVMPEFLSHPTDDAYWHDHGAFWELDRVQIPVFSIGIWGKASLHLRGNVNGFQAVQGPKHLLIAEPDSFSGAQKLFDDPEFHRRELLPWYDHHLKGIATGVMDRPAVRYFRKNAGDYGAAADWPPAGFRPEKVFLSAVPSDLSQSLNNGTLTAAPGLGSTSWSYPDPLWMAGVSTMTPHGPDHTARVCTWTTEPFAEAVEYSGQGALVMYAETDQTDMELFVKISILVPGKPAHKVTQGWLRASHRAEDPGRTSEMRPFHSHGTPEMLEPGRIYDMRVELMPMSVLVKPGNRLRLEITNWDSALLDQPMIHWYGKKVGTDTYHHDAGHPSHLLLPRAGR